MQERGNDGAKGDKEGVTSDWSDFDEDDEDEEERENLNITTTIHKRRQQQENHIHRDGTYSMDSLDGHHHRSTINTDDNSESESIVGIPRRRPEGASPPVITDQRNLDDQEGRKSESPVEASLVVVDQKNKKLIEEDVLLAKNKPVNHQAPSLSDLSQRSEKKRSRESSKKPQQNSEKIEMQETVNLKPSNHSQDVKTVGFDDPIAPPQQQQQETGFISSNSSSPRHRPSPILYPKSPSALKNLNASPSKDSLVRQYSTTSKESSTVSKILILLLLLQ